MAPAEIATEIRTEPAAGPVARACIGSYFRELAARFEGGFAIREDDPAVLEDITPPAGLFLVAYLDGEAVGCCGLKFLDRQTGELKRMWTAPSARGRGVARSLLRAAESRAREAGCTRLCLDTNRVLTEAHALYRREGFVAIERYNDNPYAHHWFEKLL